MRPVASHLARQRHLANSLLRCDGVSPPTPRANLPQHHVIKSGMAKQQALAEPTFCIASHLLPHDATIDTARAIDLS